MVRHRVSLFVTLVALWLLLSGHYTPHLLALGLASCLLVTLIAQRMTAADAETHPLHLLPGLFGYWLWLIAEIARANVDVVRCIVTPSLPISPTVVKLASQQESALAEVIYANSITLTPGTISLVLEPGSIEVHALTAQGAADLEQGAMGRRVRRLEQP